MAAKSRYQAVNRGRKGRPSWYIHNSVTGQDTYAGTTAYARDGLLAISRRHEPLEIEREALVAKGYHLPGL